jgi:hypothetical protein
VPTPAKAACTMFNSDTSLLLSPLCCCCCFSCCRPCQQARQVCMVAPESQAHQDLQDHRVHQVLTEPPAKSE